MAAFTLQQLNLLKAKQKALVEQIEKEKVQSNKGSSYKLLMEQAKLKQATSKVSGSSFQQSLPTRRDLKSLILKVDWKGLTVPTNSCDCSKLGGDGENR